MSPAMALYLLLHTDQNLFRQRASRSLHAGPGKWNLAQLLQASYPELCFLLLAAFSPSPPNPLLLFLSSRMALSVYPEAHIHQSLYAAENLIFPCYSPLRLYTRRAGRTRNQSLSAYHSPKTNECLF